MPSRRAKIAIVIVSNVQFNPSTLKAICNTSTNKAQMSIDASDCGWCLNAGFNTPRRIQIELSGFSNCDCYPVLKFAIHELRFDYGVDLAGEINGTHILYQSYSLGSGYCRWRKTIPVDGESTLLQYNIDDTDCSEPDPENIYDITDIRIDVMQSGSTWELTIKVMHDEAGWDLPFGCCWEPNDPREDCLCTDLTNLTYYTKAQGYWDTSCPTDPDHIGMIMLSRGTLVSVTEL